MGQVIPLRRKRDRLVIEINDHQAEHKDDQDASLLSVPEVAERLVIQLDERNRRKGWIK